jgi:hypothetical protein
MDVADVDNIIAQLDDQTRQIETVLGTVDAVVGALLGGIWAGPDVLEFHRWWTGTHRPSLDSAHTQLATMVRELQQQVRAQVDVSGSLAGPGSIGHASGVLAGVGLDRAGVGGWRLFKDVYERLEPVGEGLGIAGSVAGSATYLLTHQLVGRYPSGTVKAFWESSNFFHWKTSPVVHGFQSLLEKHSSVAHLVPGIAKNLSKLDTFQKGMSVAGAAIEGVAIGNDIASGDRLNATLDTASAAASIAKSSRNPVAYLSGAAAQAWVEVGKQAQNIDWSPGGLKMTFDYMRKNPWDAAVGGIEADAKYLPGALGRIFG